MRLLFVAVRSPFEGYSGNAVILRNYLSVLGASHEIDLAFAGTPEQAGHADLRRWCRRVMAAPAPRPVARYAAQVTGVVAGRPVRVSAHANGAMRSLVRTLIGSGQYDALVVQLCEAAQFVPAGHALPSVLDFEDPPRATLRRTRQALAGRRRVGAAIDLALLRRYEAECAHRFDRLVFVNGFDAAQFGSEHQCADRVVAIPHAVDAGPEPPPRVRRIPGRLILSGNMGHPPNVGAVEYVCREVFPRVRARVPGATLSIVGASPVPSVRAWGARPGITVTGAVPDIRLEMERAMVSLCGVQVVVGAQTKVLEAMACGTPVVSTPAGNYGIDGVSGRDLHVADSPDTFATRIVELLDGQGWHDMSAAGRRLVLDRFAPARAGAQLEGAIHDAMTSRRRSPGARRC